MSAEQRRRKKKTFTLDTEVLDAIAVAAENNNQTASRWLEEYLFKNLKAAGVISKEVEPLKEGRGGSREGAGRPISF